MTSKERTHCYIHGRAVNYCTPKCPPEGWTPKEQGPSPMARRPRVPGALGMSVLPCGHAEKYSFVDGTSTPPREACWPCRAAAAEKRADDAAKENGFQRDTIVALRAENERYTDYVKRAGDALASEREALAASQALVRSLEAQAMAAPVDPAAWWKLSDEASRLREALETIDAMAWDSGSTPPREVINRIYGVASKALVPPPAEAAQVAPEPEAPHEFLTDGTARNRCVFNYPSGKQCRRGNTSRIHRGASPSSPEPAASKSEEPL